MIGAIDPFGFIGLNNASGSNGLTGIIDAVELNGFEDPSSRIEPNGFTAPSQWELGPNVLTSRYLM